MEIDCSIHCPVPKNIHRFVQVSVGEITEYLIPRGYTLEVTLEIADATCGGLAMAVGMTTYSHKVGLYQVSTYWDDLISAFEQETDWCYNNRNPLRHMMLYWPMDHWLLPRGILTVICFMPYLGLTGHWDFWLHWNWELCRWSRMFIWSMFL